jgi:hypothetical protein
MAAARPTQSGDSSTAAQALRVVVDLATADGLAGPLLLATTGRPGLPADYSVL